MSDRLFIKVHHNFADHPKTVELSDKAFRQLVTAWGFCARNLNDGKLTKAQAKNLFTPKSLRELLAAPYIHETPDGFQMHEYVEHQMSAVDVSDLREKRAAAGKAGGKARARNLANASPDAKQTPSKPVADLEVDIDIELPTTKANTHPSPQAASEPDRFAEFWMTYPRKDDKAKAETAYRAARKRATQDEIITGARRYALDPNRDDAFTKLPTSWLHAGSWANGPLPNRNGGTATKPNAATQRNADSEARVRKLWEQEHPANNHQPPRLALGT